MGEGFGKFLFFAEIVRCPVARPIFDSPSVIHSFYFWTLPRSRIHLTCVRALIHCPFSRRRIPLRRVAALSTHYSFIFYFATYHHSSRFYGRSCCMGQWMDVRSSLGCFILLFVGMIFYPSDISWFEGVLPFFIFIFLFLFFGDFLDSGSALWHIASLEGVCWNIRRLCERAQCAAIPGI